MGRNNIGLYYKYLRVRDFMLTLGRERLLAGLTTDEIYGEIIHAEKYSILGGKDPRKTLSVTLNTYTQENMPSETGRTRKQPVFQRLAGDRWTVLGFDELLQESAGQNGYGPFDDFGVPDPTLPEGPANTLPSPNSSSEGRAALRVHMLRERSKIAAEFKRRLTDFSCEVCGFDFEQAYGRIGSGFIEAHHKLPLSAGVRKTTLEDFVAVCSNCHSMLHRKQLRTPDELRKALATSKATKRAAH